MKRLNRLVLSCVALTSLGAAGGAAPDSEPPVALREPSAAVKVTTDTTEVPELAPWAKEAKALVETWHPVIARLLKSDGFTPPDHVELVFKKDKEGVADTSGTTVSIAADWVKRHPDDKGMVVHELVHVLQAYPPSRDGWLVEGIADYVRFFHYEPETHLTIQDPKRASYREGYRTAAMFLAWIERTYDKTIVSRVNEALRNGRYRPALFKTSTSKSLDDLWTEFAADAAAHRPRPAGPAR